MSWADDLVIFSKSKEGLQYSNNNLDSYCNKWELSVNIEKTKCMLFSRGNTKMLTFTLNGKVLENTNGKFAKTITDRTTQTNRAIYMLSKF